MKKILGLCLVILLSSVSVFAQDNKKRSENRGKDFSQRFEKMASELKLSDEQKTAMLKINEDYAQKMKAEREKMRGEREKVKAEREKMKVEREKNRTANEVKREKMLAMREQKNAEVKKILTEEQYKQYLDKQQTRMGKRHGKANKDIAKVDKQQTKMKKKGAYTDKPHRKSQEREG